MEAVKALVAAAWEAMHANTLLTVLVALVLVVFIGCGPGCQITVGRPPHVKAP